MRSSIALRSHARCRDKFKEFSSKRRVMLGIVKGILRTNDDYLIYGDADFAPSMKGLPPGLGGALVKMANWYMPGHALPSTEFRTSKLDPESHECVPPATSSPPRCSRALTRATRTMPPPA